MAAQVKSLQKQVADLAASNDVGSQELDKLNEKKVIMTRELKNARDRDRSKTVVIDGLRVDLKRIEREKSKAENSCENAGVALGSRGPRKALGELSENSSQRRKRVKVVRNAMGNNDLSQAMAMVAKPKEMAAAMSNDKFAGVKRKLEVSTFS